MWSFFYFSLFFSYFKKCLYYFYKDYKITIDINMHINTYFLSESSYDFRNIFSLPIKWDFQIKTKQAFKHQPCLDHSPQCLLPSAILPGRDFSLSHTEALPHPSHPACPFSSQIPTAFTTPFRLIYKLNVFQITLTSFCSIRNVKIIPTFLNLTYLPLEIKTKSVTFENSR